MTNLQELKKNIKSYHRQLAMYGLLPLITLCLLAACFYFYDKSYLYGQLPLMACFGFCTLMTLLVIMSISYGYMPEIIRNVNDYWEDFIKNEILSTPTEATVEQLKRYVGELQAQELRERKELIVKYLKDIIECQRDIKKLAEDCKSLSEEINRLNEIRELERKNNKTK